MTSSWERGGGPGRGCQPGLTVVASSSWSNGLGDGLGQVAGPRVDDDLFDLRVDGELTLDLPGERAHGIGVTGLLGRLEVGEQPTNPVVVGH